MLKLVLASGLLAGLVAACGGDDEADSTPDVTVTSPATSATARATAATTATTAASPTRASTAVASATPSTAASPTATTAAAASPTATTAAATATSAPPTPTQAPPQARTVGVQLGPASFSPSTVTIAAGDTVEWRWGGGIPHTVTSRGGFAGDPAGIKSDGAYAFTFAAPGTYEYYCEVHESDGMTGTVVVQ